MEGRFKPLRPRACDACRKRKVRWAARLRPSLQLKACLWSSHVYFRSVVMALKLLEGTAHTALQLDVRGFDSQRTRSSGSLGSLTSLPHSDLHLYQHVKTACANQGIHRVTRDTHDADAASTRKGMYTPPLVKSMWNTWILTTTSSESPLCSTLPTPNSRRNSASLSLWTSRVLHPLGEAHRLTTCPLSTVEDLTNGTPLSSFMLSIKSTLLKMTTTTKIVTALPFTMT